jgi:hypothetical protein
LPCPRSKRNEDGGDYNTAASEQQQAYVVCSRHLINGDLIPCPFSSKCNNNGGHSVCDGLTYPEDTATGLALARLRLAERITRLQRQLVLTHHYHKEQQQQRNSSKTELLVDAIHEAEREAVDALHMHFDSIIYSMLNSKNNNSENAEALLEEMEREVARIKSEQEIGLLDLDELNISSSKGK